MRQPNQRGFTLLEIITVLGVLVVMLAISMLFVRPKSYAAEDNEANRRLGLAVLAQGIREYHRGTGAWPAQLPDTPTPISSQDGYDICSYLVPNYLQDLPFDPATGLAFTGDAADPQPTLEPCTTKGVSYTTGYEIRQTSADSVIVSAPSATFGEMTITIR